MPDLVLVKMTPEISKNFDPEFVDTFMETQKRVQKDPRSFLDEYEERSCSQNQDLLNLPLPQRKRYCGYIPLQIETGIFSEPHSVLLLLEALNSDVELDRLMVKLLNLSDRFVKTYNQIMQAPSTVNGGNCLPILFIQRHFMKGSIMFKVTDALVEMLDKTDVGKKTPSHFLHAPYQIAYYEYRSKNFPIFNYESGDHEVEGFYLNQSTYEWEYEATGDPKLKNLDINILAYGLKTGFLTTDEPVRILEIMFTGKPKTTLLDDATYNFTLIVQDDTKTIEEVINFHKGYYMERLKGACDVLGNPLKAMNTKEFETFSSCVEVVTKTLLYVNSEGAIRREIKNLTDIKQQIKRTLNKAKKRKLKKKASTLSDYILIGADTYEGGDIASSNLHRKVKTHWRRGHFRSQPCGEGRKDVKAIWIKPTLVNSLAGNQPAKPKNYIIKA